MKDPAILFYKDKWLMATAEMDSDVRGWYLNLILHHFDKGSLPNDMEMLASLAGVKFSEYQRFNQVFNQVLNQKFIQNDEGRLENETAKHILTSREQFKEKRTRSANIAVVIKAAIKLVGNETWKIKQLKSYLFSLSDEDIERHKNNQVLNQVLNQMVVHSDNLYINVNVNENIDTNINTNVLAFLDFCNLPMFSGISNEQFLHMCWNVSHNGYKLTNIANFKSDYFRLIANNTNLHKQTGRSEEWLVNNAKRWINDQAATHQEWDNYADYFKHFLNWTRKQPK